MLRMGLINCDPLTPPVIAKYGDYPTMFADLFALATNQVTWEIFDATLEELPENVRVCDAYLITGSHFGVGDKEDWIQSLITFIQTLWEEQVKTIGICFGHQAMAQAMGGQVDRAPNGWGVGVAETTIIKQKPWMLPWQAHFNVHISHQDQVLTLPPKGQCLGKTTRCPNAIIQIGETFLSFQGHPEFNQDYTQFLINKRKDLFNPDAYEDFLNSLSLGTNNDILVKWIINFLLLNHKVKNS